MAAQKPLQIDTSGNIAEVAAVESSAGSGDEGKIVALNAAGQIDSTMLPTSSAKSYTFSEAVAAGGLINFWNNTGTINVRNADNSAIGKSADGYAPAAVAMSATGVAVAGNGDITGLSGLTVGAEYFLGTAGAVTTTPPTASASIVQKVGRATSTTELELILTVPVLRA